jgi:REP element-mobilizing transposase RayT
MENNVHNRRSIRLKHYDYSRKGYYFITICTYQHQLLFGKIIDDKMILNDFGKIVNIYWRKQETDIIRLHEHIVMPNHFHGIVEIISDVDENREIAEDEKMLQRRKMILPKFVGKFKMQASKEINIMRNKKGTALWQRNYYEHVIRDDKDYGNTIDYIQKNPENWRKDKYY